MDYKIDTEKLKLFGDIANTMNESKEYKNIGDFKPSWDISCEYKSKVRNDAPYFQFHMEGLKVNVERAECVYFSEIERLLKLVKTKHSVNLICLMDFKSRELSFIEDGVIEERDKKVVSESK